MSSSFFSFFLLLLLLLFPLLTPSFELSNDEIEEFDEELAYLRVLHASPDSPAVNILLNNNIIISTLSFSTLSNYTEDLGGTHTISVQVSGTNKIVLNLTLNITNGYAYTLVLTGFANSLSYVLLTDENPIANMTKVRISHFSPDSPSVSFALTNIITNTTFNRILSYGSSSPYLQFPGGTYQFTANVNGALVLSRLVTLSVAEASSFFIVGPSTKLIIVADGGIFTPATLSPTSSPEDSGGLSNGAIAAIVICSLIGAAIVGAFAWYFFRNRRAGYETVP